MRTYQARGVRRPRLGRWADERLAVMGGAAGAAAAGPSNPTIPGYEFRGELGRGGMGTVIRCRDLHLDRDRGACWFIIYR